MAWDSDMKQAIPMQAAEVPESRQLADRLERTMTESIAYWRGLYERASEQRDATRAELEDLKKRISILGKQAEELGNPSREVTTSEKY